jgi:hypothetical protein
MGLPEAEGSCEEIAVLEESFQGKSKYAFFKKSLTH